MTLTVGRYRSQRRVGVTVYGSAPRRRHLSDGFLAAVAAEYRRHVAAGVSPTATIAAEQQVTPRAVRAWLKQARGRGLLGPGSRGRAGEFPGDLIIDTAAGHR